MIVLMGVVMGLLYVAPPGPVNAETINRGLRGGFRVALAVQLGALVGDVSYAVLALAGGGRLTAHATAHTVLGVAGTALLAGLGLLSARDGLRMGATRAAGMGRDAGRAMRRRPVRRGFAAGTALSLLNPYTIAFWLAVGGSLTNLGGCQRAMLLGGFGLGVLLWGPFLAALVSRWRDAGGARFFRIVALVNGVVLIVRQRGLGLRDAARVVAIGRGMTGWPCQATREAAGLATHKGVGR